MKVSAYKCDICKTMFESESAPKGIRVVLQLDAYESLSRGPKWYFEHVCDTCRGRLSEVLADWNWPPLEETLTAGGSDVRPRD